MNHHSKPYWVGTIKPGPVIWAFSTALYVLIIKSLGSTEKLCFDPKSLYLKQVTFLSILMVEQKRFNEVFLYLTMYVFLKFCWSGTKCQANARLNLCRKT